MNTLLNLDNNIKLIDLIINSINDLIYLIQDKSKLNDTIFTTITLILDFLGIIIKSSPQVLISENNFDEYKSELLNSYTNVYEHWTNPYSSSEQFTNSWYDFYFWWQEFNKSMRKIIQSSHTIYLSMN